MKSERNKLKHKNRWEKTCDRPRNPLKIHAWFSERWMWSH